MVLSLKIGNRNIKDPKEMKEGLINYFKNYFGCSIRRWKMGVDLKFKLISEESARKLEAHFSMEEIKEAVWSCDKSKVLEPDGFKLCFYRKCWEIVKHDLLGLMSDFFTFGKLEKSINSSFIILIPKVENPTKISEFRPICLVSSLYKIVSKVLSRRLKEVVGEVVSETQCTFIKVVTNVKYILRVFEIFSGQSINFNKSCLVGFEVEEELLFRMATICKCKIGNLPFNYLGVPLGANPKRLSTWEPIIDRVRKKLSRWKCRSLSWAGRVVLINVVLSLLPIYFMSLFHASVTIIKRIDKIKRNFLWGNTDGKRKIERIRWDIVCKPKVKGGVGVANLGVKNKALLAKWSWRFANEKEAL
ncbi:hypothetical protein PVK06_029904 [Gossypium arboreum]|uniref:Uncharacterized protein n=1 Tax=Gossypium arboreum TaxID=29729 RepID=A0ABR0NMZ7_GOSAR|nr:hypothetical protein PVK06_029904 [Gossypium arboreum]